MTIGFMPSYYDNHQAEKDFGEISKEIEKYCQKNIYVKIAYNSFCVCVCVCVDNICVLL